MHTAAQHFTNAITELEKYSGNEAMTSVVRGLLAMALELGAR